MTPGEIPAGSETARRLEHLLRSMRGDPDIEQVTVFDRKGSVVAGGPVLPDLAPGAVSAVEEPGSPAGLVLRSGYPNPFTAATTIEFEIPEPEPVTLRIYSLRGELVRTLVQGTPSAERNRVLWDGRDETGERVGAGVYLYRLATASETRGRKFVRIR